MDISDSFAKVARPLAQRPLIVRHHRGGHLRRQQFLSGLAGPVVPAEQFFQVAIDKQGGASGDVLDEYRRRQLCHEDFKALLAVGQRLLGLIAVGHILNHPADLQRRAVRIAQQFGDRMDHQRRAAIGRVNREFQIIGAALLDQVQQRLMHTLTLGNAGFDGGNRQGIAGRRRHAIEAKALIRTPDPAGDQVIVPTANAANCLGLLEALQQLLALRFGRAVLAFGAHLLPPG